MNATATVQVHLDAEMERRAAEALKAEGLTVEDAIRLMLERTAMTGELPFARAEFQHELGDNSNYDEWFRAKVQQALDNPNPGISHEEVKRRWAIHREELLKRAEAAERDRRVD